MQSMMPLYLYIAKRNKVPIRIAHAHNSNYEKTFKGIVLHFFSRLVRFFSTNNFACSKNAGKYLFGNHHFEVIYNGVNIEKFQYDEKVRNKKRKELQLNNKFTILHIGRFELQKNHRFLIEVFENYTKENENSILLLLGEGKMEKEIKKLVEEKKLENKIRFLGIRKDVNEIMQAADCFVLPSLYEGFPVVGVEAQIAGLPCIFSDRITKEVKILRNSYFLEINKKNIKDWSQLLSSNIERLNINYENVKRVDIENIAKTICERYYEEYRKRSIPISYNSSL